MTDTNENTGADFPDWRIGFDPDFGGFPSSLALKTRGGEQELLRGGIRLAVGLAGGKSASPVLCGPAHAASYEKDGARYLDFENVPILSEGKALDGWRMNLSYELNPEGVGFVSMYFGALQLPLADITGFRLSIPMRLGAKTVTCGWWSRPSDVTASDIQAIGSFVRGCTDKSDAGFSGIVPLAEFSWGEKGYGVSRHIEWMMEGKNAVAGDPENCASAIRWEDGEPVLEYEFASAPVSSGERPYQWRNQLGFVLGQTPKVRDKAPLRAFHWLDLYQRYPTSRQIGKMAAEGADALILHEGWRSDIQCGGVPCDPAEFERVAGECREHGMRLAVYARGTEQSVREDLAPWFGGRLRRDFDGIYSDYGSPLGYSEKSEEFSAGRIRFRDYYHRVKLLRRETIGKDGIYLLHTGPFFCGAALPALLDAYTAGEGEKGVLLSGRREHAYYSAAPLGPGALWTAAFPDYESQQMLPYMANIGQFPHVSLGAQIACSSLAHPRETGCVTYARPLWKFYGLMAGERNLGFSNDLCDENIRCGEDTGAAVFTLEDGARLMLVSNFSGEARACRGEASVMAPSAGEERFLLLADQRGTSLARADSGFPAPMLPAWGVAAVLCCTESAKWRKRLESFLRPYPAQDAQDAAYRESVEKMRALRFSPAPAATQYLRVSVPTQDIAWEDSVWWDLYNSSLEFWITPEGGERRRLGFIGRDGFTAARPEGESLLWPGHETPWIPLHGLLPKGRTRAELRVSHYGEDFYSFAAAECAAEPDGPIRRMEYMGELDKDRARLTFDVELS